MAMGRVKRSSSNAMGGPGVIRKKLPGSVTSSLNSSESETGQGQTQQQNGQRSVFLHAACVADIPPQNERKMPPPVSRALSAEGARDGGPVGGHQHPPPPPQTSVNPNLQKSKKISRSISLLAPWSRPKGASAQQRHQQQFPEIYYDNTGKPPRPLPSTAANRTMQRDKKSASSHDLLQDNVNTIGTMGESGEGIQMPLKTATVQQRPQQQPQTMAQSNKVSRSVSMPKDTRLAGWFKKRKRM